MKISDLLESLEQDWLQSREKGDTKRCSVLAALRMTLERSRDIGFVDFEQILNLARQNGNTKNVKFLEEMLERFQGGTAFRK